MLDMGGGAGRHVWSPDHHGYLMHKEMESFSTFLWWRISDGAFTVALISVSNTVILMKSIIYTFFISTSSSSSPPALLLMMLLDSSCWRLRADGGSRLEAVPHRPRLSLSVSTWIIHEALERRSVLWQHCRFLLITPALPLTPPQRRKSPPAGHQWMCEISSWEHLLPFH